MACPYHTFLSSLCGPIFEKIENCNVPWDVIKYWFGDESYFDNIYVNVFSAHLGTELTDEQKNFFRKKGLNLEKAISTWFVRNPNITDTCVYHKIGAYIEKQIRKPDMRDYIGIDAC